MADYFSPSAVARYLKGTVEHDSLLSSIGVEGEISNFTRAASGYCYFSLKDKESVLPCIMYPDEYKKLPMPLENGMSVLAKGSITVFVAGGKYQLRCKSIQGQGVGDLQQAFAALQRKLQEEGLFDPQFKKPLPFLPKRVALITSPTGAVVRDMIRILGGRCPMTQVSVIPVRVQGSEAVGEISGALQWVNYYKLADLIIVGRGGGSMEDLWAFNEEAVARAIFASQIPVISAVGHEPDVTIADYVADVRGATPTHAAEMAVPKQADLEGYLRQKAERMEQILRQRLLTHRKQLEYYAESSGFRDPKHHIREKAQLLDYQQERLTTAMNGILAQGRHRCGTLSASLHALSPLEVMGRGYAIPRNTSGKLIQSVTDTQEGDSLSLSVTDGRVHCRVERTEAIQADRKGQN